MVCPQHSRAGKPVSTCDAVPFYRATLGTLERHCFFYYRKHHRLRVFFKCYSRNSHDMNIRK